MFNYVGPQGKEGKVESEGFRKMDKSLKWLLHLAERERGRTMGVASRK